MSGSECISFSDTFCVSELFVTEIVCKCAQSVTVIVRVSRSARVIAIGQEIEHGAQVCVGSASMCGHSLGIWDAPSCVCIPTGQSLPIFTLPPPDLPPLSPTTLSQDYPTLSHHSLLHLSFIHVWHMTLPQLSLTLPRKPLP